MTKRDEAKQDYLAGMKPKEIAAKHNVSAATVRSWKARYWNNETQQQNVATKSKSIATKNENVATQKELHPAIKELEDSDLNPKQKAFVREFVRLSNATQAYINAYDVTYNTAMVQGSVTLRNPKIKTEIKRLRQARLKELGIDVFSLVDDLAAEARADIGSYVDFGSDEFEAIDEESGKQYTRHKSWVALKDKSQVDTKALKKITNGKDGPIAEVHDRNRARDRLFEYLLGKGIFAGTEEEHKVVNDDSLLNAIKKSSKEVFDNDNDIES